MRNPSDSMSSAADSTSSPTPRTPETKLSSSLDESWVLPQAEESDSSIHSDSEEHDDDGSSVTLGSSLVLSSSGSGDTHDDHDDIARTSSPLSPSHLLSGEWTDAEAASTHLSASTDHPQSQSAAPIDGDARPHSSATSDELRLVYPDPLDSSFASSTTVSDTTPTGSIGSLPPFAHAPLPRRSSRYRLESARALETIRTMHGVGQEGSAGREIGSGGSLWSPSSHLHGLLDRHEYATIADKHRDTSTAPSSKPSQRDDNWSNQTEPKNGMHDYNRLDQGGERNKLQHIMAALRGVMQNWSLRTSIIALIPLLSMAFGTVQYWKCFDPAATAPPPLPINTGSGKPFSILDYLSVSVPSLSLPVTSVTSDTSSSSRSSSSSSSGSYVPDIQLIKNALSLSTKSAALPPAKIKQTESTDQSDIEVQHTAKSAGPTSYSLSLRNTDVALTTLIDASAKWHKTIRSWRRPSNHSTSHNVTQTVNATQSTSYGSMMHADLRNAWQWAITEFSHVDILHFIRNQVIQTLKVELHEAALIAQQLLGMSWEVTRFAGHHFTVGATRLHDELQARWNTITSMDLPYAAHLGRQAEQAVRKARAKADDVSARAAATTQGGKEALYRARAGLDHLIEEAKRFGRFSEPAHTCSKCDSRDSFRSRPRSHRRHHVRGAGMGHSQFRKHQQKEIKRQSGQQSTWTQKVYRFMHDVTPAFIL